MPGREKRRTTAGPSKTWAKCWGTVLYPQIHDNIRVVMCGCHTTRLRHGLLRQLPPDVGEEGRVPGDHPDIAGVALVPAAGVG